MDIAITIFRIGVGVGAVLVGLGIVLIAISVLPLARDVRALANDARRLANLAERELANIVAGARELRSETEALAEDLELRLGRLRDDAAVMEDGAARGPGAAFPTLPAPRSPAALPPVQSRDAREDERIA